MKYPQYAINQTSLYLLLKMVKSDEPIFVTKNGYDDMVIMSIEAYEKISYINDIYKKIEQGEKAISENRVINTKLSVDSLRSKYEI